MLDGLQISVLSDEDIERLDRLFAKDEVFNVVKNFNGDKALGSGRFYHGFLSDLLECCGEGYHGDVSRVL